MYVTLANGLVLVVTAYLIAGLVFALLFVTKGVQRVDPTAKESTIGFRLIIIPGVAAFWPLLARRWLSGANKPPQENTPRRLRLGQ
jgi:hypothetical protein